MKCNKCHRQLHDCQSCKGQGGGNGIFGKINCSKCNGGLVCPTHGKHW
jgi:hypothetical protein